MRSKSVALRCAEAGWPIRCNSIHPSAIDPQAGVKIMWSFQSGGGNGRASFYYSYWDRGEELPLYYEGTGGGIQLAHRIEPSYLEANGGDIFRNEKRKQASGENGSARLRRGGGAAPLGLTMIRVEHFSKQYEDAFAVRGLSFEVEPGQILGLVGPNGAGKTTTLRTLAGILPPSDGTLEVAGYDIVGSPIEAKRRLAFVPDVPHLFDHLSVWEHLAFTARIYGVRAWEEPAQELLERFEIAGHADKMADELSLGMSAARTNKPRSLLQVR